MEPLDFLKHMAKAECVCDPDVGYFPCETCMMEDAVMQFEHTKNRLEWIIEVMKFVSTYEIDDIKWNEGIDFIVNCSDFFYWGTADAEYLTPETMPILYDAFNEVNAICPENKFLEVSKEYDEYGAYIHPDIACLLYCAKIRKKRPQDAYYKHIPEWAHCLFDQCGSKRDRDFLNPGKIGDSE